MKGLCTTCFQRVEMTVYTEGAWRVMICPECGAEFREPAGQHKHDKSEHRREKPEDRWR